MSEEGKTRGSIDNSNTFPFSFRSTRTETRKSMGVDDTVLVRRAQRGDTAAFEELIRHYDEAILCFVLHLTGSQQEAREIYQESLLRAYTNLPAFRFECSFYTWIFRIVANRCLGFLHTNKLPNHGGDARNPGERQDHGLSQPNETIARALAKLSPRERVVFELRHYHGLRLVTVADLLNISEAIIRNTLLRAAHKLQIELSDLH